MVAKERQEERSGLGSTGMKTAEDARSRGPDSADLDMISRMHMERCASFIARMIEKYGAEVLAEIEAEERAAAVGMA